MKKNEEEIKTYHYFSFISSFSPFPFFFLFQFHSFFRFPCFLFSFSFVFLSSSQLPALSTTNILFVLTCLPSSSLLLLSRFHFFLVWKSFVLNRKSTRSMLLQLFICAIFSKAINDVIKTEDYFERKERKVKMWRRGFQKRKENIRKPKNYA